MRIKNGIVPETRLGACFTFGQRGLTILPRVIEAILNRLMHSKQPIRVVQIGGSSWEAKGRSGQTIQRCCQASWSTNRTWLLVGIYKQFPSSLNARAFVPLNSPVQTMLFALWTLILGLLAIPSAHAFIGISIEMYNPSCAFACRTIISSAMLDCPSDHGMDHGGHRKRHGHTSSVTPACRAVSVPFLTTLAYCINEKCYPEYNPPKSKIEWYFAERATGDSDRKLEPMWSYGEALAAVNGTPTAMYSREEMVLNETMLVDRDEWLAEKESMEWFWWQETLNSRYR